MYPHQMQITKAGIYKRLDCEQELGATANGSANDAPRGWQRQKGMNKKPHANASTAAVLLAYTANLAERSQCMQECRDKSKKAGHILTE
jgi:hypothetical protein